MDIVSYSNCIPDEFLEESDSAYEDYQECLTKPKYENDFSKTDRFTEYIINVWQNHCDKETE